MASGNLTLATATLTNAQILAAPTTPVQILPAPGAGKVIVPFQVVMYSTIVSPVTNIDGDCSMGLVYGLNWDTNSLDYMWENNDGTKVSDFLSASQFVFMTTVQKTALNFTNAVLPGVYQIINNGLYFNATNGNFGAGNFTGGNPGNSIKVFVWYDTISV